MQIDPTILTLTGELLVIFLMLMCLMLRILRRLEKTNEKVEANTAAINSLAVQIDTRTAELDAKIDTRTTESDAKANSLAAAILAGFEVTRERIDLNRERIDDNRTRIDSFTAYLREFRIETRETFDLIRARIEKLDDHPVD